MEQAKVTTSVLVPAVNKVPDKINSFQAFKKVPMSLPKIILRGLVQEGKMREGRGSRLMTLESLANFRIHGIYT